jgi:Sec63 Brl domain
MLRQPAAGGRVKDALDALPRLSIECTVAPITRTVLRVSASVRPQFAWRERVHGSVMRWLLWVEDTENDVIYHHEMWMLNRKMMGVCSPLWLPSVLVDSTQRTAMTDQETRQVGQSRCPLCLR